MTLAAGNVVFYEGELGTNLYIVESGMLTVTVNEIEVGTIAEGTMFGELSLLFGQARNVTVTASGKTKLWSLDRKSFRATQIAIANPALPINAKRSVGCGRVRV